MGISAYFWGAAGGIDVELFSRWLGLTGRKLLRGSGFRRPVWPGSPRRDGWAMASGTAQADYGSRSNVAGPGRVGFHGNCVRGLQLLSWQSNPLLTR